VATALNQQGTAQEEGCTLISARRTSTERVAPFRQQEKRDTSLRQHEETRSRASVPYTSTRKLIQRWSYHYFNQDKRATAKFQIKKVLEEVRMTE